MPDVALSAGFHTIPAALQLRGIVWRRCNSWYVVNQVAYLP